VDQETGDSDPPVADRNFGRQETEFRSFREASLLAKAPSCKEGGTFPSSLEEVKNGRMVYIRALGLVSALPFKLDLNRKISIHLSQPCLYS
jgi:hypothetical protein